MHRGVDEARLELVRGRANEWAKELIDLDHRNVLVNFKNTKTGSLDLNQCTPEALDRLQSGQRTSLRSLFDTEDSHRQACSSVRDIHRKIVAFREEQGVDVGKLACGLVRTQPPRGGGRPVLALRAPLLLRSIEVRAKSAAETDFVLQAGSEVEVNPVLLYALQREYGVEVDLDEVTTKLNTMLAELTDATEQAERTFALLMDVCRRHGTVLDFEPAVVIGIFNYQKLAMVRDLASATELMAEHDLVAALAGDENAAGFLLAAAQFYQPKEIDSINPRDEYLIHDSNSSQQQAIETALAGHHVIIEGPPGTGKSQTIANLIAEAAARGLRVLFVAEKRAAIEAVTDRLTEVHLADLVLDLHAGTGSARKRVAAQLAVSLAQVSQQRPVDATELQRQLTDRRARLAEYMHEVGAKRPPWQVSAFEVWEELLSLGAAEASECRFTGAVLADLKASVVSDVADDLTEFVELGGVRVLREESPWAHADIRGDGDARRILAELDELASRTLRRSTDGMDRVVRKVGLIAPGEIAGWQEVLSLLDGVAVSVSKFGPDIFGENLDSMWWATANYSVRRRNPASVSGRQRRALVKQVREACSTGIRKKADLHRELTAIRGQRDCWRQLARPDSRPAAVIGLEEVMGDYQRLRAQLAAVALSARIGDLATKPAPQVQSTLDHLRADRAIVFNLPRIHELRDRFNHLGLTALLAEIAERDVTAEQARAMFRHAWLRGLDDEFRFSSRALREFSAERHDRIVAEYRRADIEHRRWSAQRVHRKVAVAARDARDAYPNEARLLRDEASKKARHLPLRKLVQRAPHVLLALRPCWAMSPLLVSQALPAQRLFDLVIFDEASQIKPHDAVTSIMRGERLVVAGDEKQLPPSAWFDRVSTVEDDEEDADSDLGDYESILTALRPIVPHGCHRRLQWHYRSQDERLIAFSNREMYDGELITFPGARMESPVRLDVVDSVASPGQGGLPAEEVSRVVELVIQHAEQRPDESLGVITLGAKHQARVEKALRDALGERQDLDEFFAEDAGPVRRFFVKNIETVQGDERDAIILSVGVARSVTGVVSRTAFGALNRQGSERRVNVAITRAKRRMTVVTSFPPGALEPSEKINGTEMLRRYLETVRATGDPALAGRPTGGKLNGFERSIATRLAGRKIDAHPQWGVSGYRIDFALAHPHRPGQMVLAVEADGDSYHRTRSTRDRDRLRQEQLQRLGWKFHRVWASAWFADPEAETDKIVAAWTSAVATCDAELRQDKIRSTHPLGIRPPGPSAPSSPTTPTPQPAATPVWHSGERGPRPVLPYGPPIDQYSDRQLIALFGWLIRDGLPLDREERIRQAMAELGLQRLGTKIRQRLRHAAEVAQRNADPEER